MVRSRVSLVLYRLVRAVLLTGAVIGLVVFGASVLVIKMVELRARTQPLAPNALYSIPADTGDAVHYLTREQDMMLSYAFPAIWIGIGGALVMTLLFSLTQRR